MKLTSLVCVALLWLAPLAACKDPSQGKAKATTTAASSTPDSKEALPGVRHEFDASTSRIEWVGSKVTGKHEGGFRQFRGAIGLVDDAPEKSQVVVEIDADSIYSDSDRLVKHLKTADFFDVAKHPAITFRSTEVKKGADPEGRWSVTGNLSLHGVSRSITFPATIRTGSGTVEVDAEFAINRKEFGLLYAGKQDDLIRDDVVVKLTIRSARKS